MRVQTHTYSTTWLGQPALALETSSLTLITVPGMGAKIVSLVDKEADREWLLPPIKRSFHPVAYGAPFIEQDMSGWDEMFPTIDACPYPVDGRYQGTALPDHGEVWSIPWHIDDSGSDVIRLSTIGRALPYRLSRSARVLNARSVRLEYEVINTGSESLSALWAAHPQFAVNDETRLVLPPSVNRIVNVQVTEEWGDAGLNYPWPTAQARYGQPVALDRVSSSQLRNHRKVYVPPDTLVSWAGLQQGAADHWLRLSWDASAVPYLGIWVDEGVYNAAPTVALEPSTGFYDSLALAWQNKRVMQLLPNSPCRWSLDVEVGSGALDMVAR